MGLSQQLQEKSRVGCIFDILGQMSDDVLSVTNRSFWASSL
jgi:hypothetical protein